MGPGKPFVAMPRVPWFPAAANCAPSWGFVEHTNPPSGAWPKAGPPAGGMQSREARGGNSYPYYSLVSSQMAPPLSGLDYVHSEGARSRLLVVKIGKNGLVII